MIKTFQYRLKSKNTASLNRMVGAVNFVWNYCNQTGMEYLDKRDKWITHFDFSPLVKKCSSDLGISAQTIKIICKEYCLKRSECRKRKLAWRSRKRSLGWIPFSYQDCRQNDDCVKYLKKEFRFWYSRPIEGEIKCGSFSQDAQGKWYVNIVCETEPQPKYKSGGEVGIDLGLKTLATLSNGSQLTRPNLTQKLR